MKKSFLLLMAVAPTMFYASSVQADSVAPVIDGPFAAPASLNSTQTKDLFNTLSGNENFGRGFGTVYGYIQDKDNISRISLNIRRSSDGYFWNGASWQVSSVALTPTLSLQRTLPDGTKDFRYEYRVGPKKQDLAHNADYVAALFVADSSSNNSSKSRTFQADKIGPVLVSTAPGNNTTATTLASVRARLNDAAGVDEAKIAIRRLSDNFYWNASTATWTQSYSIDIMIKQVSSDPDDIFLWTRGPSSLLPGVTHSIEITSSDFLANSSFNRSNVQGASS